MRPQLMSYQQTNSTLDPAYLQVHHLQVDWAPSHAAMHVHMPRHAAPCRANATPPWLARSQSAWPTRAPHPDVSTAFVRIPTCHHARQATLAHSPP